MLPENEILQHYATVAETMDLEIVHQKEQRIPNSVQYVIRRYAAKSTIPLPDSGMLVYNFDKTKPRNNFLELRYCITGNRYCSQKNCLQCNELPAAGCSGSNETVDVFHFHFSSTFLHQFVHNLKVTSHKDEVLAFKYPDSFIKTFSLCNRKRAMLNQMINHSYDGSMENIFINAKVHELLLNSIECLTENKEIVFSCSFLADEEGRERILKARDILLQHIGEPITIKELSRKVAINECYLKKGFKEMFGTTIFDFYQQQRMEHAKYLLYEKSLSVTDVSALLGYSYISHFSAAFKKHTGLKPCELLS